MPINKQGKDHRHPRQLLNHFNHQYKLQLVSQYLLFNALFGLKTAIKSHLISLQKILENILNACKYYLRIFLHSKSMMY